MIRAIVFDFGQTLVDSAEGFRTAEKELQRKAYAELDQVSWMEFLDVYREIRSCFHARSNFSRKEILEALFGRYGQQADPALIEQWETGYWKRIKVMTRVFPETENVLETLQAKGCRLALITNAQGRKAERKHRLGHYPQLERFFEVIIVAGEGKVPAKPDPAPFHLCLERLGIAPYEAVYVGDDWPIDVCGSEAAGMHPVWLQHRLVQRHWPVVETSAPVIDSLEGLVDIESIVKEAT
jgi:HAD superfamily hydrolase (TIGR01549 family)